MGLAGAARTSISRDPASALIDRDDSFGEEDMLANEADSAGPLMMSRIVCETTASQKPMSLVDGLWHNLQGEWLRTETDRRPGRQDVINASRNFRKGNEKKALI